MRNPDLWRRMKVSGYRVLPRRFYVRNPGIVARNIIGKYLVRFIRGNVLIGRIVEAEAYYGKEDPASHAFPGMTPRNRLMFGPGGKAYIYLAYGNHFLLNVVCEKEGMPGAVLVRAVEPVRGVEEMARHRGMGDVGRLTNGPGRLTEAFAIDARLAGCDLRDSELLICRKVGEGRPVVAVGRRIGISRGKELCERYYVPGSPFISASGRSSRTEVVPGYRAAKARH